MKLPCENCLVFPLCKVQLLQVLERTPKMRIQARVYVALMESLCRKCTLIKKEMAVCSHPDVYTKTHKLLNKVIEVYGIDKGDSDERKPNT